MADAQTKKNCNRETPWNPAVTLHEYNIASTSMQRHDVASTLSLRCINVMFPLGTASRKTTVGYGRLKPSKVLFVNKTSKF